jgi:ketosteroid isomerase-like protein
VRMAIVDDVGNLIEQCHLALDEFMKGNPEPAKKLWSRRDDATLTNPQGSAARGWDEVAEAMERAASTRREGRFLGFETLAMYATDDLAYVVELERLEAKVHGGEEVRAYTLRVTMMFRPEVGKWKVVHRHADQIISA